MTDKERELLNALNIIKKVCNDHHICDNCPCCCNGECMVHKKWPNGWDLVEEQPTWKAFNH